MKEKAADRCEEEAACNHRRVPSRCLQGSCVQDFFNAVLWISVKTLLGIHGCSLEASIEKVYSKYAV